MWYRAWLTFQIQSGTSNTDENLRQEIAFDNENLMRQKSTDVNVHVGAHHQTLSPFELGHIWLARARETKQELQQF